jgi:hypothetical protein
VRALEAILDLLSHPCLDCGMETSPVSRVELDKEGGCRFRVAFNSSEQFLLWPHIWAETGLGPHDGALCVGCAEKRLGRRLRPVRLRLYRRRLQRARLIDQAPAVSPPVTRRLPRSPKRQSRQGHHHDNDKRRHRHVLEARHLKGTSTLSNVIPLKQIAEQQTLHELVDAIHRKTAAAISHDSKAHSARVAAGTMLPELRAATSNAAH